ncbi:MAG: hypothetical protein ACREX8_18275, partial [Gammaproteobacteria bacterium]
MKHPITTCFQEIAAEAKQIMHLIVYREEPPRLSGKTIGGLHSAQESNITVLGVYYLPPKPQVSLD